jgi:hypothetical protein
MGHWFTKPPEAPLTAMNLGILITDQLYKAFRSACLEGDAVAADALFKQLIMTRRRDRDAYRVFLQVLKGTRPATDAIVHLAVKHCAKSPSVQMVRWQRRKAWIAACVVR